MKVVGFDNKVYNLKFKKTKKNSSKLHERARLLLTKLYPCDILYEEVTLPGSRTPSNTRPLRADFIIPGQRLMVEVQGEQHFTFNSHFFENKHEWYKSIKRDGNKKQWCFNNNIRLVQLPYNEDDNEWIKRLQDD